MQQTYQAIIQGELPQAAKTIPLDHLEATYRRVRRGREVEDPED